jgi:hypothetical protein
MVQRHCPQSEAASSKAGSIAPLQAVSNGASLQSTAAPSGQNLEQRVKQLIDSKPIMLFMKAGISRPLVPTLKLALSQRHCLCLLEQGYCVGLLSLSGSQEY